MNTLWHWIAWEVCFRACAARWDEFLVRNIPDSFLPELLSRVQSRIKVAITSSDVQLIAIAAHIKLRMLSKEVFVSVCVLANVCWGYWPV